MALGVRLRIFGVECAGRLFVWLACLSLAACTAGAAWQETTVARPSPVPSQKTPARPTSFPSTVISTPPAASGETETLVLKQVSEFIPMCPPDFGSNEIFISADEPLAHFSLDCDVSWGHVAEVWMRRYATQPEAQSAFAEIRGDLAAQDFHGYPALGWECFAQSYANCYPSSGIERGLLHRNHCWQADRWLICAHAFDDSGWRFAPAPLKISEAVYQASVKLGLFPNPP